jgi:probable HAF family extracellular repeat protein
MCRFHATACATLAVTVALSAIAGAAPLYTLIDLGSLRTDGGEVTTTAYDVNELGQVIGRATNSEGRGEAYRTAPNAPINPLTDGLGYFDGVRRGSEGLGMNDLGQVAGDVQGSDTPRAFFTPPNGRIESEMGAFTGGTVSIGSAINNKGQVAVGGVNDVLNSIETQ